MGDDREMSPQTFELLMSAMKDVREDVRDGFGKVNGRLRAVEKFCYTLGGGLGLLGFIFGTMKVLPLINH